MALAKFPLEFHHPEGGLHEILQAVREKFSSSACSCFLTSTSHHILSHQHSE
uniref:Uncharacterized protein n=1 Tax=Rhizophora mucronata TaxID=61149 RepID=A0A2P2N8D5_RHIMU